MSLPNVLRAVLILTVTMTGRLPPAAEASEPLALVGVVPQQWPTEVPTPAAIPLPAAHPALAGLANTAGLSIDLVVKDKLIAEALPAQFDPGDRAAGRSPTIWFTWNAPADQLGKQVIARIRSTPNKSAEPIYQVRDEPPQLFVRDPAGTPILGYWYGEPPSNTKNYPLRDFIHPIVGLDGESVTDLGPGDHVHHRGIFWPWVTYRRHGETIAAWWIPSRILCEPGQRQAQAGPVFGGICSQTWLAAQPQAEPTGTPNPDTVERFLEQRVAIRVFATTPIGRAIDVDLSLRALTDGIEIAGQPALNKGYGGMTFRYAPAQKGTPKIVCSGQHYPRDVVRYRSNWADWTAKFTHGPDGQPADFRSGAALLVHPDHPGDPVEWLTRHYGVLCICWPGLVPASVAQDEPLRLRYRIWVHRGDTDAGQVDQQYQAYAADWHWQVRN